MPIAGKRLGKSVRSRAGAGILAKRNQRFAGHSYTRPGVSEHNDETTGGESAEPRMRRRLLGYRPADVEAALAARESELAARDAELVELRQDIAALWLAFAQHDRMLGELRDAAAPVERPSAAEKASEPDPSVGRQLAELDEVLAAIEMATQTLERTYAEEAEEEQEEDADPEPEEEPSGGN